MSTSKTVYLVELGICKMLPTASCYLYINKVYVKIMPNDFSNQHKIGLKMYSKGKLYIGGL